MSGGQTHTTQNANGKVDFNPTSIGGGNISVGGSVGQGTVQQSGVSKATGSSTSVDVSMPMPVQLINLNQMDLQNLGFLDNMLDNIDTSGPQVTSKQVNSQSTTYGNNGGMNVQSNHQNTVTATGGGPSF